MGIFSRRERREPPAELVAAAAQNTGGSVAEIDRRYVDDPDGYVPAEAVRGVWRVDDQGRPTGEYEENPRFGPPQDDFGKLTESDQWLGWLGEDPAAAIRESVAGILEGQAPGAALEWFKVLESPRYLTGGRRQPDDPEHIVVTRMGIAVSFALSVSTPGRRRETLLGVFSWTAADLDRPGERRDRVWFDLRADLDWAEEQLRERVFAVDGR